MSIQAAFGCTMLVFITLGLLCSMQPQRKPWRPASWRKPVTRRELIESVNGRRFNPWRERP